MYGSLRLCTILLLDWHHNGMHIGATIMRIMKGQQTM